MDKLLYTVPETCRLLNLSRSKLYTEITENRLSSVHNGRRRFFHRDEVERYAQALVSRS